MPTDIVIDIIVAGLGIALSPFPIIAIALLLGSTHPRSRGFAFTGGWLTGLSALTFITYLFITTGDDLANDQHVALQWLRIGLGLVLLWVAAKKWQKRPAAGEAAQKPSWMKKIDTLSNKATVMLGLALGGLNLKNLAFAVLVLTTIVQAEIPAKPQLTAAIGFILVGSSTVLGLLAFYLIKTEHASTTILKVKTFMIKHNQAIMAAMMGIFGLLFIQKGLYYIL